MTTSAPRSPAFVRHEPLPPQAPPVAETGMIKWVRENLFSSIPNGILTVAAIWAIYSLLSVLLPWIFNGIWSAESVRECNEQLLDASGAASRCIGANGGGRWFSGFIPTTSTGARAAFVLLVAPSRRCCFPNVPRKLLYFTLLYPFMCLLADLGRLPPRARHSSVGGRARLRRLFPPRRAILCDGLFRGMCRPSCSGGSRSSWARRLTCLPSARSRRATSGVSCST